MANTFGILTALVLAFTAFVSFKNKEEFANQKGATERQQASKDLNTKTFEGLVAANKVLLDEKTVADASTVVFNGKLEAKNTENEEIKTLIASKERDLESVKSEVADARDLLKELGPIALLAEKIDRLQGEIDDATDELTILNTSIDRLRGEKERTNTALANSKSELSDIMSGRSLPAMSTSVDRIDRRLGFVILANGINSGVVGGSRVAVMRGGEKVAELNVTAVSANAATADIIHSTLKDGENVIVGDKVVPIEGLKKAAE